MTDPNHIETICRAMQAVSRPDVDPDKLTPGPRGAIGYVPVWQLYEHMAKAAFAVMPLASEARIKELQAALSSAQADRKALMEVVRGAMCRRLDGEHTLKTAIIALPPHLMKEAQE